MKILFRIATYGMENIKRLMKRSQTIIRWYNKSPLPFLRTIPLSDYPNLQKIRLILAVRPYSYTPMCYQKLSKLYEIANTYLEREGIDGNFVECGVWNGGSAGIVAAAVKDNKNRHFWLFDSWSEEITTLLTKDDISFKGETAQERLLFGSEEKAKELIFKKLKLNKNRIHFVKGWFHDTIPHVKKDVGNIALLHLDCDWYESIRICLEELYDSITPCGFTFVNGYHYWMGCKKAVDQFIEKRNLKLELIATDFGAIYFQKPK